MVTHIIAFAAGVWLLQQQARLPELQWGWLLPPAMLLAAVLRGGGKAGRISRLAVTLACAAAAGFFWAAAGAHWRLADHLPPEWESRDIVVTGVVAGLPQAYDRSVRFEFDVEQVLTPEARVPHRIVLSWWGRGARDGAPALLPDIRAGERWQLTVRLKRPHGLSNPHGFDYEAWLLERGIRATGYVRPKSQPRRVDALASGVDYRLQALRERLRGRIRAVLGDAPAAGVITALAMGDQRAIPTEQWQTFTRTGVNHLMSISGLHVTMLSGLAFALANLLWRRSARLTLALPAVKAAAAIGFAVALGYALIAGFAVPAQRTVFMLAVVAMALWSGRIAAAGPVLAMALFAVLVIDPWAVNAPGFWLSFGAVAVIMWVSVNRLRQPHWLVTWGRVQWAVTLALVPPLLAMFQQVSLVSPLANAIAIPLVSFVVVPPALAGMLLPLDFPLDFAQWVMACCLRLLEWLSHWSEAAWQQHAPPPWTVFVALAGTAWLLLPRGFPGRWIGAIAFLPMFLVLPAAPPQGALRLTVLDVGQGLAVVAQTGNHALLFDAGPAFGPGADSGSRVIVPFLRGAGIRRIDMMVVSHDDADHTGGVLSVLQALPVDMLLTSLPDLDPLLLLASEERRCMAGQRWRWDGIDFEMLHPDVATRDADKLKDNERSCVLRITTAAGSVLIPADIERRGEQVLLATMAGKLKSDVLVAPHQGSRTSSSQAFVEAVAPRLVIFPVGYRNPFRHPHPEVVARYVALGSVAARTDEGGAISVLLQEGRPLSVTRHRDRYVRYWHAPRTEAALESELPAVF